MRPPELAIDDPAVYDSDNILAIPELPASLVVLGGGAVGCEYASLGATLGVKVTLVTRGDCLVPRMDIETSRVLAECFNGMGIRVIPKTRVLAVERCGRELSLSLEDGKKLPAEAVLVATGRRACIDGLGLEAAGIEMLPDGDVKVDERFATTAPGIYAAGDVIGPPGLASTSMEQARVAMCHAFGFDFKTKVDSLCPTYVFSIPEVAAVGLSEEAVRAAGISYEVGRASFSTNAKALTSGFPDGFVKLIFRAPEKTLLGIHIVGEQASELIHIGQLLLHHEDTIDRLIDTTFAVPTRSDAYKYAAYDGLMRLARGRATKA